LNESTLCFDFGNTRLKCGHFSGDLLLQVIQMEDGSEKTITSLIEKFHPSKTILSSVIDHDPGIEKFLLEKTKFHKLNSDSKLPFSTPVGKPETIGADRLALSAAAVYFYHGKNNLVIGMGSCITFNFINKYNSFLGGSISPGMEMRFKAMHDYTAKLPLINPGPVSTAWNFPLIGYDTRTNILSGVLIGIATEIDGVINLYKEKFSNFNVLLTGGDMLYFAHLLKNKIFADPDLIFKGLYAISEQNDDTKI
jgi:type III pantothenate kinase